MELELDRVLGRTFDRDLPRILNEKIAVRCLVDGLSVVRIQIVPRHHGLVLGDPCRKHEFLDGRRLKSPSSKRNKGIKRRIVPPKKLS